MAYGWLHAQNDNEMSYIAHGDIVWCERWDDMEWFDTTASCLINYRGWVGNLRNPVLARSAFERFLRPLAVRGESRVSVSLVSKAASR